MILKKRIFLATLFYWIANIINAQQNINFSSLTTRDGLSSNTINAMLKDSYGLMWLATEDGLDRFDGSSFKIYRHKANDTSSLPANETLALHEDKSGNLWIGTSGGSLCRYDRKKDVFIQYPAGKGKNSLRNNVIRSVSSDRSGKIWIAHFAGVDVLDPATGSLTALQLAPHATFDKTCISIAVDHHNNIWIGTGEGAFCYSQDTKSLQEFLHREVDTTSLAGNVVSSIKEDNDGNIWIGTNLGLSMLPAGKKSFVNYRHKEGIESTIIYDQVTSLAIDDDEKLCIGTWKGLDIMDRKTNHITHLNNDPRDVHSLNTNGVFSLYIDNQGIYWIGTFRGGVNKYDKHLNLFNLITSNPFDAKALNAPIVTSFAEDRSGNIFVATEGGGVSLFYPNQKTFKHYDIHSKQPGIDNKLLILAMKMTKQQQLLVGTYSNGLFVLDPVTGRYTQFMQAASNANDIFCITEDRKGNWWVGTNGDGVQIFDVSGKIISRLTPTPHQTGDITLPINAFIRDVVEDSDGNMWIATHGGGIAMFEPTSKHFTIYNTNNSNLPNDKAQSILEDSRKNIWIATFGGGICMIDKQTKKITTFSEVDGLPNNTIYKILEDKTGHIWISSNKGLSRLDISTKKINNYNHNNGVQNNNFVHGSGLCLSNGDLYFGGLEGFNYFNPKDLKQNKTIPPVIFTELKIDNQIIGASEDGAIRENITMAKEINLDFKQNFMLGFVGLNYTAPEQNQYSYQLEGFDKAWNNVGNATSASYTNLDPGTYTFHVRACNNDGVWNMTGASIIINVHPPFWRTTVAYVLYFLAIAFTLFMMRRKGIQKINKKYIAEQQRTQAEQERKEADRIHELDQLKLKFLTNLSHEFRTPISLILGPTDTLLKKEKDESSTGQLSMIKRNAKRLLNLVNQLLDFRKMEENELHVQPSKGELVSFVREVAESFKDMAERKDIDFVITLDAPALPTSFDHDKLERILFNLLSNAFKFTLEKGKINLVLRKIESRSDAETAWISISISDNGIGIPADKKDLIFDRFFQQPTAASVLNQGSGIGLSITKEFVKMLGGNIVVESEVGKGTTFTIELPVRVISDETIAAADISVSTSAATEEPELEVVAQANEEDLGAEMPLILLVEDNDDFRFYLKDNLRMRYKVLDAANGKEGWQKALAQHPQLIVSDVNMPIMDGIDLCKKIKSDPRTMHIPVILLTALTGEEDQLKGLETGANDYISKPFNFEVLGAKIKNLLTLNNTFKKTYTKQLKVIGPEVVAESKDEKLLDNIMRYLDENLTNSQLSVEELSRHLGMGRGSLYSKLLELTGQSPVDFIRSVKLNKGAALLEKSDLPISQIASSVGFANPNYFTKAFKKKFDMLPSEYIQKKRAENKEKDAEASNNTV